MLEPHPKQLAVVPMNQSDIPAVIRIQAACYPERLLECEKSLSAKLAASPESCFVLKREEEVVAYLISLPSVFKAPPQFDAAECVLPSSPDTLYLHDLAVAPAARGTGAGKVLVQCFLEKGRALKVPRCSLIAVQNSSSYWAKYGFRPAPMTPELEAKVKSYEEGARYMMLELL